MKEKVSIGDIIIHAILTVFSISIIYAFWHMLVLSFSPGYVATQGGLHLWTPEFTWDNYAKVLKAATSGWATRTPCCVPW